MIDYKKEMNDALTNYCAITRRKPGYVGALIVNDGDFFNRIKNGGTCTVDTFNKVMKWFQDNTPKPIPPNDGA